LVEVMEPLGSFILENNQINTDSNVVLWGAGSGITPLMSIAKYALQNKIGNHVTLVYGNRSHESVIFKDQLEQLKKDYSENFSLWYFFTLFNIIPNTDYFVEGRIDPQKILTIIKKEKDLNNTFHYICGPEGLKESVKFSLANFGINDNNVFSEDFSVTRDPAEFDNIITRNVLITKDGKTTQVEVVRGKSILEAGLDSLIDLSYSCQTGDCLLCKGQLKKGSIKLIGVKISPNLESNECLLCCSFPLDDFVEINIKNEN